MKRLQKYYNERYFTIALYVLVTALSVLVIGWTVFFLSGKAWGILDFFFAVLKPLVLGLVFTYLFSPVVKAFENKLFASLKKPKAARVSAVVLTYLIILLAIILILGIILVTVTQSLSSIRPSEMKQYLTVLGDQFSNFGSTIEEQLASMNINLGSLGELVGKIFNGIKTGASTLLFAVIFSIYFLIDRSIFEYWKGVLRSFTSEATRERIKLLAKDSDKVFSGYIRGQSIDAAIVGVMSSIALLIAGIPYAVVIGILTGIGNLVPYVGPVVGFGSLIIVCLAEGSLMHLLIGGIILAVVMFVDGNIINPRMLSSNVEVHPVLVIVALLAGGKVGGVVGMLVAVPVAALLKLQFERFLEKKKQQRKESQSDSDESMNNTDHPESENMPSEELK